MNCNIVTIFNGTFDGLDTNIKFDTVDNILYLMTNSTRAHDKIEELGFDVNSLLKQLFNDKEYLNTLYHSLSYDLPPQNLKKYSYYHEFKLDSFRLFITMLFSANGIYHLIDENKLATLKFYTDKAINRCSHIEIALPYVYDGILYVLFNKISDMINGLYFLRVRSSESDYVYTIQNQIADNENLKEQYLNIFNKVKNSPILLKDTSMYNSYEELCKNIFTYAINLLDVELIKNGKKQVH